MLITKTILISIFLFFMIRTLVEMNCVREFSVELCRLVTSQTSNNKGNVDPEPHQNDVISLGILAEATTRRREYD